MAFNLEELGRQMLAKTTTNFDPHPDRTKYNGFTCPVCGRHEFGTSSLPNGVTVGHCHGHDHSANGCTFSWDRNNAADEAAVMYQMTREEWVAQYSQSLPIKV